MKTVAIIQARIASTRLPAKTLLPLPNGNNVIQEVLDRVARIPMLDEIAVAVPDAPESDMLESFINPFQFKIVRGSEADVLARYARAAEVTNADVIVRITSDCPLISPYICHAVISEREMEEADYASNVMPRTWPLGQDCQVFTRALLKRADVLATDAGDREHVCPWMERAEGVKRINVTAPPRHSLKSATLDTLQDYIQIWNLMNDAGANPLAA